MYTATLETNEGKQNSQMDCSPSPRLVFPSHVFTRVSSIDPLNTLFSASPSTVISIPLASLPSYHLQSLNCNLISSSHGSHLLPPSPPLPLSFSLVDHLLPTLPYTNSVSASASPTVFSSLVSTERSVVCDLPHSNTVGNVITVKDDTCDDKAANDENSCKTASNSKFISYSMYSIPSHM